MVTGHTSRQVVLVNQGGGAGHTVSQGGGAGQSGWWCWSVRVVVVLVSQGGGGAGDHHNSQLLSTRVIIATFT